MTARGHLRIFAAATAVWAGFWLLGLPTYYQQYSLTAMVWFCALLLVPITAVFAVLLCRVGPSRRMRAAMWYAFYFTLPLFAYDWLYCGVYLGHGPGFLTTYWYLTVYYFIPWIVLPVLALILRRVQPSHRQ